MPLISEEDRQFLVDHFSKELKGPVKMVYFTQRESKLIVPSQECMYCRETREILQEVSDLSDKIDLEVKDFVADSEEASTLGVERIPATVLTGAAKGKIRYFGIPSGYEFATLIESIVDVSNGTSTLTDETKAELSKLDKDLHIQVFVTPT
jgi:glutaredoxin-like protein